MAKDDDDKTLPKGETADDIKELSAALKGDLTKLAGPKADKLIARWDATLDKVGTPVKGIRADLAKLREHVTGDEPDGAAIAKVLAGLSTKTAKVAEDQGGVIGTALKSLAGALDKASTSLTDGDDGEGDDKGGQGSKGGQAKK